VRERIDGYPEVAEQAGIPSESPLTVKCMAGQGLTSRIRRKEKGTPLSQQLRSSIEFGGWREPWRRFAKAGLVISQTLWLPV
jgi:hypothetical protein